MDGSCQLPARQKKLRKRRSDKRRHFKNYGQLFMRRVSENDFSFSDDSTDEVDSTSSKNTYTISSINSQVPNVEVLSSFNFLSSSESSGSSLPDLLIEEDQAWMERNPTAMVDIKRMISIMDRQRREKTRNDWRKNYLLKHYHGAVFCKNEKNTAIMSFCDRCTKQFNVENNDLFTTLSKPSARCKE